MATSDISVAFHPDLTDLRDEDPLRACEKVDCGVKPCGPNGCMESPFQETLRMPACKGLLSALVADSDGDKKPDLIVSCRSIAEIWVYSKMAGRTLSAPRRLPAGHAPQRLARGDFNKDGRLDLVASVWEGGSQDQDTGEVSLLWGRGGGSYNPPETVSVAGHYADGLAVADFDGDGVDDLAVKGGGSANRLYGGSPPFARRMNARSFGNDLLASCDTDGDRRSELYLEGDPGIVYRWPIDPFRDWDPLLNLRAAGEQVRGILARDLDGDGHCDLIVDSIQPVGDGTYLYVKWGNGRGEFPTDTIVINRGYGFLNQDSMRSDDMNGDGRSDLIVGRVVYLSQPNRSVMPSVTFPPYDTRKNNVWRAVADLDGDGFADIIGTEGGEAFRPETLVVYWNNGKW